MSHRFCLSRLLRIGAFSVLALMNIAAPASAATIIVGDTGDPAVGNAANCDAPSTCALRDAIARAAPVTGTGGGDTIVFDLPADSTIALNGHELSVDRNLTIDGSSTRLAISGTNASRVFYINGDVTVLLNQLVIKEGFDDGSGAGYGGGGGIYNSQGTTLMLTKCTISNNNTDFGGGGIYNLSSTLILVDSKVASNIAANSRGGGIYHSSGALTLIGSTIVGNTAAAEGGGIYNPGNTATLIRSAILNNSGSEGGGIYNFWAVLTLIDSTVSDNTAIYAGGGINNNGTAWLTNSTVAANTAFIRGGGIYNTFGTLTLTNSTVVNNVAVNGNGGGVYNGVNYSRGGKLMLFNGTLSGNVASGSDSDIYNYNYSSTYSTTEAVAANTIVRSCSVDGSNTKAVIDNGGNVDGGNGCGFTSASSRSDVGAALNLGPLGDNGGPTQTMLPGTGSPAIGLGLISTCRNAPVNSRDQRGYVRFSGVCSSGAADPIALANDSIFFDGFGFD